MQIKLNLVLSLIVEAIKAETFIKGTIDRSAGNDQHASNAVAYNETIGDEDVHERKILRDIYTSSDKLRSYIQDYLTGTGTSVGSNVVISIDKTTDAITITLDVSSRFRKSNSDSLARLCSKYIQDEALVLWWTAIGTQAQLQYYTTLANEDIAAIQRMFVKGAPSAVTIPYTSQIKCMGSQTKAITMDVGEESTVTYTIDDNVLDDIEVVADTPKVSITRTSNGSLSIKALHSGICNITLYSIHDESVYASLEVTITSEDGEESYYNDSHRNHPFRNMYPRY